MSRLCPKCNSELSLEERRYDECYSCKYAYVPQQKVDEVRANDRSFSIPISLMAASSITISIDQVNQALIFCVTENENQKQV